LAKLLHREKQLPKNSSNRKQGDFLKDGIYYEYKASGFNEGDALHIVQIREWQNCDYIVQKITSNEVYTFRLNKDQMKREIILCNAQSAHGTPLANKHSENIEMRISIAMDSQNWHRWIKKYLC